MANEEDTVDLFKCTYCSCKIGRQSAISRWEGDFQYTVLKCECGRENWVKVNLDEFNPGAFFHKKVEVESVQRKVREK